jgi:hypothetical protein
MKRLVALVLCLLPSLALAIPPYPTVWYREQTVRNTADIRALQEEDAAALAAVAGVESNLTAHATDTENPHGVTAEQIGALTEEEDAAALAAIAGVESNVTALAETVGGITAESLGALTEEEDAAALAAIAGVESNVTALAEAVGGITAESLGALTEEEDAAALAAVAGVESNLTAHATDTENPHGVTAEQIGALTAEETEVLLAAATNALLDLAGTRAMTGDFVTLARDVKSRNAASVGDYGAAFGYYTTAGNAGAAFGVGTTAGYAGAAFGDSTKAGDYGFSAGRYAHGSTGSFVFADSAPVAFDRTNSPNSFSVRAAGGTYFDTPLFTVTGEVAAARIALGTNAAVTDWPQGTILGATINGPHTVATNDGILAFTVASFAQVDTNEVADATLFTPDFVGQLLIGSESNLVWVAGGVTTNDWLLLTVTE